LEFFAESIGGQAMQMEALAKATSIDDLFLRLEAGGIMLRIDPDVRPGMMHYATISIGEVALLRQIRNVIRKGHVSSIERDGLYFSTGHVPVDPGAVHRLHGVSDKKATARAYLSGRQDRSATRPRTGNNL
jgi:hypothetical protein